MHRVIVLCQDTTCFAGAHLGIVRPASILLTIRLLPIAWLPVGTPIAALRPRAAETAAHTEMYDQSTALRCYYYCLLSSWRLRKGLPTASLPVKLGCTCTQTARAEPGSPLVSRWDVQEPIWERKLGRKVKSVVRTKDKLNTNKRPSHISTHTAARCRGNSWTKIRSCSINNRFSVYSPT